MDCTASMSSWMLQAKETLITLIDKMKKTFGKLEFRVAFVGYRDYCDKHL
jgi:hypothetical protein